MSGTRNLEGLKMQALTCIEAAYDKGYKSGLNDGNINDGTFAAKVKDAYDNGLNDAWECAKKIYDFSGEELSEIFPKSKEIPFYSYSALEAVTKIKEYEDRQKKVDDEIHVGNEVYAHDKNVKKIVLGITEFGNFAVLSQNGNYGVFSKGELHKTGKAYPVAELIMELDKFGKGKE